MALLRTLCWTLIFILRLRFPPSSSLANKSQVDPVVRPYFSFRDEITIYQDVLLKGDRIIVPTTLRNEMRQKIHHGHFGIEKCKARARLTLYWPGMVNEIMDIARFGIPKTVMSDNGPQFAAREYKEFARELGFYHDTSRRKYPKSNGLVERTIQTVKKTIKKAL